jgi:hypothetical protein
MPVVDAAQKASVLRLGRRAFLPLSPRSASRLVRDRSRFSLKDRYYLARAAYWGGGTNVGIPSDVHLGAEATDAGIVYVTSFRLTHQDRPSQGAVVLIAPRSIKGVRALCSGAE